MAVTLGEEILAVGPKRAPPKPLQARSEKPIPDGGFWRATRRATPLLYAYGHVALVPLIETQRAPDPPTVVAVGPRFSALTISNLAAVTQGASGNRQRAADGEGQGKDDCLKPERKAHRVNGSATVAVRRSVGFIAGEHGVGLSTPTVGLEELDREDRAGVLQVEGRLVAGDLPQEAPLDGCADGAGVETAEGRPVRRSTGGPPRD